MLFQIPCLWILTVDLHNAPLKLCKVISNSDIKSPAHQFQHVSLYHYLHRAATHCHGWVPWSTHMLRCLVLFPPFIWWCGVKPTRRVVYLFSSPYYLMTRCETHTPHCLSLFLPILSDDAVWNPHAASSSSFPPHIIWRRSVQPTHCVIYFFSSPYYLMTQCETHMLRRLFLFLLILSDDVVCNPHTMSSIL